MGGKTKKTRVNLSIDPDIYKDARRVFNVLELNMSAFLEGNLAQFLQVMKPLRPLMEDVQDGKKDPAQMKTAMRVFLAHSQGIVGGQIAEFGKLTVEMAEFIAEEEHTDKK